MKIKILHIPNYYPPHIGGIEDVCYSIVSAASQYQHVVICFNDKRTTNDDFYEGVRVIRCGVLKKLFSQSLSLSLFTEMKSIFREFSPEIIHFHTPNPLGSIYLLYLLPQKTKLIVHWHSDIVAQKWLSKFYSPIEKRLLKRADKILVTSPTYISGSEVLSPWKQKVHVIPNTVNTQKLDKRSGDDDAVRKIKELYGRKKIVFTFGRHVPYKGLRCLIEAAPLILKDAVVVIAGTGPLTPELKSMSAASEVYFPGRLSNDELRQYLYAADVFAFPSITRNEAFGIALAEAMYCGLSAVTFTIPDSGVNWVCPNGETGLEVENENVRALASAINELLRNTTFREQLGINASKRARELFISDSIVNDLIDVYENKMNLP